MTIEQEFNEWFEKQVGNGLVDFKLDVRSAPASSTKEEAMAEILFCEKQIALGNVEEYLPAPDQPSAGAEYIILSCIAGTEIDDEKLQHLKHLTKMEKLGYTNKYCDY